MIAFAAALLLAAATIAAWFVAAGARAPARVQLRFAAALLVAPAVAAVTAPPAASAVVLLVLPIAVCVLALAAAAGFERALLPTPATLLLALVSLCGIASAVTGLALFALGAAVLASAAMMLLSLRQFDTARRASVQGAVSAACLLAAQSAFALEGTGSAFLLFAAAGLLGIVLALSRSDVGVDDKPAGGLQLGAIRGRRPV